MKSINPVEKEINTIRENIYEDIKEMTPSEMTAYVKQQVTTMHERYCFRTIPSAHSGDAVQTARR